MIDRRHFLGAAALGALAACSSDKADKLKELDPENSPDGYYKNPAWLNRPDKDFDYFRDNGLDNEGRPRTQASLYKHRPSLAASGDRREFRINFHNEPPHPHEHGHHWAWIELMDGEGQLLVTHFPDPVEDEVFYGSKGVDFTAYFQLPTAATDWVRIRARCEPHGVFTEYFHLSDESKPKF